VERKKKKRITVLFSSSGIGHDKRPVQGNGTASRELSPIPTVPTSDRNKSSFDSWKPLGERGSDKMPPSRDQNVKRNDAILTSDHLGAGEPRHAAAAALA
jgi:hypothetical protein